MRLILEVIAGPLQGKQIEAKVGETVRIGRTTKADVAMDDSFMSGEHFAIECSLRSCRIRDLNSRNGTQLNGKMITAAQLSEGDHVHAGRTDFRVRIEDLLRTSALEAEERRVKSGKVKSGSLSGRRRRQSKELSPVSDRGPAPGPVSTPATRGGEASSAKGTSRELVAPTPATQAPEPVAEEAPPQTKAELQPVVPPPPEVVSPPSRAEVVPQDALASYEAATPEGRLVQILSSQPGSLMALVDGVRDSSVLELIRGAGEGCRSLYSGEQNAAIAPYLVALMPRSELLKQMVHKGWGREWGVYLTCPLSLLELREFFRTSLMVRMPDGTELFSRFYDPRFFRSFLETCTPPEAEKFFGPITSYFMEDERREILLQFTRGRRGAEKKGHLLSVLP